MTALAQENGLSEERSRRNRTLKKAFIRLAHQDSVRPCVLRNISETGALLEFEDADGLPLNFALTVELDGFQVDCKWIRRLGNRVAVNFTSAKTDVGALRKQVVHGSNDRAQQLALAEIELKKKLAFTRSQQSLQLERSRLETVEQPKVSLLKSAFGKRK